MRHLTLTYCAALALALAACNASDPIDDHTHPAANGDHEHAQGDAGPHEHTPDPQSGHTHDDGAHDHPDAGPNHVHTDEAIAQVWALIDAGPHHEHVDAGPHHEHVDDDTDAGLQPGDENYCSQQIPAATSRPDVLCFDDDECDHLTPPVCLPGREGPVPSCTDAGNAVLMARWRCRRIAVDGEPTTKHCISVEIVLGCSGGTCGYHSDGRPGCYPPP